MVVWSSLSVGLGMGARGAFDNLGVDVRGTNKAGCH